MKEFWQEILLLLVVLLSLAYIVPVITGYTTLSLSIKDSFGGEITAFTYYPIVNVSKTQDIFVEFYNPGSETYSLRLEEYVYFFDEVEGLQEVAHYYDSTIECTPGTRRVYETTFVPNRMGFFYIKVKATMGTRKMESWGNFYAVYPEYAPYVPAQYQPIVKYIEVEPSISLEYPDTVELYPGRSVMTNLRVRNTGNATLHEVKLHLSTSNLLEVEVNPKESYYLDPNKSVVFLIDVSAPSDIPIGQYPIDFELVTREMKDRGTITIDVKPYNMTLEEEVRKTIQNYEFLIAELQREIVEASARDVDVTAAQITLDEAKTKMLEAKTYFDSKDYENAKSVLDKIKELLKETALKLEHAEFTVFVAPAFSPLWILLILILIVLFFFFRKKRKEKEKPKLLRSVEAET